MSNKSIRKNLHATRMVLSFTLLGAVVAGAFFGWIDADPRPWGAAAGATGAIALKLFHIL